MKNILKALVFIAISAIGFAGCKKDEQRNFFLGGKNPSLTASKTDVVLTPTTQTNEAIKLNWTNPEYQFSTGLSSQDVQYALELDVNPSFSTANKFVTTVAKDLSKTYSVLEMNNLLLNNMLLPAEVPVTVYARVKSSLRYESSINGELISNSVSFRTRPYDLPPVVDTPSTGRLVAVGSATPGGWDNNANNAQVFTKVSKFVYTITLQLTGGGSMLMLPVAGSWDDKYGFDGAGNTNNVTGDKMARGGGDIKVPATSGMYKIEANFKTGRFTITPQ